MLSANASTWRRQKCESSPSGRRYRRSFEEKHSTSLARWYHGRKPFATTLPRSP